MSGGRTEARKGAVAVIPIMVGALPFGLLFGTVANQLGLSLLDTMLMSALINAGTAQIVGVGMITAGAAVPVAVATILVVNLRHVFYSAALAAKIRHLPPAWRAAIAFGMTDAIYALAAVRYEQKDSSAHRHWYVMSASVIVYIGWLVSTLVGWVYGGNLGGINELGLDFAIYATYLGLVVSSFTSVRSVIAGVLAGALSVVLHHLPYLSGLFCSTLLAVLAISFWDARAKTNPSSIAR